MPAWLLKLLQPLYALLVDKFIKLIKDKVGEMIQNSKDKKKIKEILDEKHPVKRANKLRNFINGK